MRLTSTQLQGNLSDAGKVTFKFIPNLRVRTLSLSYFLQELVKLQCVQVHMFLCLQSSFHVESSQLFEVS